jgi:hypothetical protein
MQVGPRIPGEYSYTRLKLAQLLGQLGVFLAIEARAMQQSIVRKQQQRKYCGFAI